MLKHIDLPENVLIVNKPGKGGHCKAACEHPECQAPRVIASAICVICKNAIGYERPYRLDFMGGRMHHTCAIDLHHAAVARNYLKKEARLVA